MNTSDDMSPFFAHTMEQRPIEKPIMTTRDFVKAIPTLAFGVSSVCFILGLLIVNLHLSKYGIYSKEFLRTEYLLAGAVCIILVVIAEISFSFIRDFPLGNNQGE